MQINEQRHGAVTVLTPEGALVEDHVETFRQRLEKLHRETMGRIVVNFSGVPFVDSEGLEAMLTVTEKMAQQGRALRLCAVNDTVREVLELTGLAALFEQYEDANEAVRSFL